MLQSDDLELTTITAEHTADDNMKRVSLVHSHITKVKAFNYKKKNNI